MKHSITSMMLIMILIFSGCSHETPNPQTQERSLTTAQKVGGTTGGILLGAGGALVGGMMGILVSGGTSGVAPLIGVILGGTVGAIGGISVGMGIGDVVD